jgi:hypothetical protein
MAVRSEFGCFTSEFDGFKDEQLNLPGVVGRGCVVKEGLILRTPFLLKQAKISCRETYYLHF